MTPFLRDAGVALAPAFDTAAPPGLVGFSSAVKPAHPARAAAQAAGVRQIPRGELLAEVVAEKKLVAVCGSHGKTTTCGMLAAALDAAGAATGYVLGGLYRDPARPPARACAHSPWVVAEIDESDGTIAHFAPEITAVVNLDWDHPDYYRTEADLEAVFAALFRRTRGDIFIPAASERLRRIAAEAGATATVHLVGNTEEADAIGNADVFSFNAANQRLALAVTRHIAGRIGQPPLGDFNGIRRRQDVLFEVPTLRLMADYAHHPTEISALLRQLRLDTPGARLVAVFQPHRHSRTRQYAAQFAAALAAADEVFLLPVYAAGEAPLEGGTTASVLAAAAGDARFSFYEDAAALRARLGPLLDAGRQPLNTDTTLVFTGAGDIGAMAVALARELRRRAACEATAPLGRRTTLGAGGPCAWFAKPASLDELRLLLDDARADHLTVLAFGRGSNLLVPDAGFPGIAVSLAAPAWRETSVDAAALRITSGAGAALREVVRAAADAGLDGFTFLDGIPGTLGGALRVNAGAAGAAIFDRVENVTWLDAAGTLHERTPGAHLGAVYRDCPGLRGAVVLGAELRATGTAAPEDIRAAAHARAAHRLATQPREPSAGSVFKNPPGENAGRLIDSLGLKGLRIGGAAVSTVHANFIVNEGGATAADIIALVRRVRAAVREATGIALEPEIHLAGQSWSEVLP
jgi:UDP-N-acetylenolpyruvoylglucosamine reductase